MYIHMYIYEIGGDEDEDYEAGEPIQAYRKPIQNCRKPMKTYRKKNYKQL